MKDLTMDRRTLQMGSTQRTRFYQTTLDRKIESALQGALPPEEALQAFISY